MAIEVGKVIGLVTSRWWAQVHDFVPDTADKLAARGRLVVAVSLQDTEGKYGQQIEAVAEGREVLSRLHELYYGDTTSPPLEALKQAVNKVGEEFLGIETVCLALLDKVGYVVVGGEGGVWVSLPHREGWVVPPAPGVSAPRRVSALSGWLLDGEVIVAGNSRFWQSLPLGTVRAAVRAATVEGAVESLAPVVHGGERGAGGVGVVIKISHPAPASSPVVVREEPDLPPETAGPTKPAGGRVRGGWGVGEWLRDKLPKPRSIHYVSYADPARARRRTMWLGVGFLVVVALLVGGWQIKRRRQLLATSQRQQQVEELVYQFDQAQALVELNPARSQELVVQIKPALGQLLQTSKKGKVDPRLARMEAEIAALADAAAGIKRVAGEEVLNLQLVRLDISPDGVVWWDDKVVVLDSVGKRLVVVDPDRKSGEIAAGEADLGRPTALAAYPGKLEVLSDRGVVECTGGKLSCQTKIDSDSGWGEVVDMGMFAGNVYLLSRQQLWRHQVTGDGFGPKQAWLAKGEDPAVLADAAGLAIDGSIWVVTRAGQILKFTRGVKDSWAAAALTVPLGSALRIDTHEDTDKLYVLDSQNNRLVVFGKTGEYVRQYLADQIGRSKDLVVDGQKNQVYLVAEGKLWRLGLE